MSWLDQLQRPEAETGQERITGSVEPELGPNDDPSSMLLPVRLQSILHQTPVPQCLDCRMSPDDQLLALRDRRKTVKIREVSTGNTVERMVFPNVIEYQWVQLDPDTIRHHQDFENTGNSIAAFVAIDSTLSTAFVSVGIKDGADQPDDLPAMGSRALCDLHRSVRQNFFKNEVPIGRFKQILKKQGYDTPGKAITVAGILGQRVLLVMDQSILLTVEFSVTLRKVVLSAVAVLTCSVPWYPSFKPQAEVAFRAAQQQLFRLDQCGVVTVHNPATGECTAVVDVPRKAGTSFAEEKAPKDLEVGEDALSLAIANTVGQLTIITLQQYFVDHPEHTAQFWRKTIVDDYNPEADDLQIAAPSTPSDQASDEEGESEESSDEDEDGQSKPDGKPAARSVSRSSSTSSMRTASDAAVDRVWHREQLEYQQVFTRQSGGSRHHAASRRWFENIADASSGELAQPHAGHSTLVPLPSALGMVGSYRSPTPAGEHNLTPQLSGSGNELLGFTVTSAAVFASYGSSEESPHGELHLYTFDDDQVTMTKMEAPAIMIRCQDEHPGLHLTADSILAFILGTTRRALVDEFILFEQTRLARQLCWLNDWDRHTLNSYQLETALRFRQLENVEAVLRNIAEEQVESACEMLLKTIEDANKLSKGAIFAQGLLHIAITFVSRAIQTARKQRDATQIKKLVPLTKLMMRMRTNLIHPRAPRVSKAGELQDKKASEAFGVINHLPASAASDLADMKRAHADSVRVYNDFPADYKVQFELWDEMDELEVLKDAAGGAKMMMAQTYFSLLQSRAAKADQDQPFDGGDDCNDGDGPTTGGSAANGALSTAPRLNGSWIEMQDVMLKLAFAALLRGDLDAATTVLRNLHVNAPRFLRQIYLRSTDPAVRALLAQSADQSGLSEEDQLLAAYMNELDAMYPNHSSIACRDQRVVSRGGFSLANELEGSDLIMGFTSSDSDPNVELKDLSDMQACRNTLPVRFRSSALFSMSSKLAASDGPYSHVQGHWASQWSTSTKARVLLEAGNFWSGPPGNTFNEQEWTLGRWHFAVTHGLLDNLKGLAAELSPADLHMIAGSLPTASTYVDRSVRRQLADRGLFLASFGSTATSTVVANTQVAGLHGSLADTGALLAPDCLGNLNSAEEGDALQLEIHRLNFRLCLKHDLPAVLLAYVEAHSLVDRIPELLDPDSAVAQDWLAVMVPFLKADAGGNLYDMLLANSVLAGEAIPESGAPMPSQVTLAALLLSGADIADASSLGILRADKTVLATPEAVRGALQSVPLLEACVASGDDPKHGQAPELTMYNLLEVSGKGNVARMFQWQQTNKVSDDGARLAMPHFSGEMSERFALIETLDFKYYLQQGRPLHAYDVYKKSVTCGSSVINPQQVVRSVSELAIMHFHDDAITSACLMFFELLHDDSAAMSLRDDVAVAQRIFKYESRRLGGNPTSAHITVNSPGLAAAILALSYPPLTSAVLSPTLRTKSPEDSAQNVLERLDASTAWLVKTDAGGSAGTAALLGGVRSWQLVNRFCRKYMLPFRKTFLETCASSDNWALFLGFAQLERIPLSLVLNVADASFRDPAIQSHVLLVLQAMQLESGGGGDVGGPGTGARGPRVLGHPGQADLFDVVFACEQAVKPAAAFVEAAATYQLPQLVAFGASGEVDRLTAACAWFRSSLPGPGLDTRVPQAVPSSTEDFIGLISSLCSAGLVHAIQEGLFVTDSPHNPIISITRFYFAFKMYDFHTSQKHLFDFKMAVDETEHTPEDGPLRDPQTVYAAADAIILKLLKSCPTNHESEHLLRLLSQANYSKHYVQLHQLHIIMTSVGMNLSDENNPEACVDVLAEQGLFNEARAYAQAHQVSEDHVTLKEVTAKLLEYENSCLWVLEDTRRDVWQQFQTTFLDRGCAPDTAGGFFIDQVERCRAVDGNQSSSVLSLPETVGLLSVGLRWLSGETTNVGPCREPDEIQALGTRIWRLRIQTEVDWLKDSAAESSQQDPQRGTGSHRVGAPGENGFFMGKNLGKNQTVRGWGTMESASPTLSSVNLPKLGQEQVPLLSGAEERRALDALIGDLLNDGDIAQAADLAVRFQYQSRDVVLIAAALKIAHEQVQPKALDLSEMQFIEEDFGQLNALQAVRALAQYCGPGQSCCRRIFVNLSVAKTLNMSYAGMLAKEAFKVLKFLILRGLTHFETARSFISMNRLQLEGVAQLLGGLYVEQLVRAEVRTAPEEEGEGAEAQGTGGDEKDWASWSTNDFAQYANLCQDPGALGRFMLDAVVSGYQGVGYQGVVTSMSGGDQDQAVGTLSSDVEATLLCQAHYCFVLVCSTDSIDRVLIATKEAVRRYSTAGDYQPVVKLLVNIKRFREMEYVLDKLVRKDKFELLLAKDRMKGDAVGVVELKLALRDYLLRRHPQDAEKLQMVSLHFQMYREIGDNRLHTAMAQIKQLGKRPPGPARIDDLLYIIQMLTEAASNLMSEGCPRRVRRCLTLARLVGMQVQMVDVGLMNLDTDDVIRFLSGHPNFKEALLVAEAYDHTNPADWISVIYAQVIEAGNLPYIDDYVVHYILSASMLREITNAYLEDPLRAERASAFQALLELSPEISVIHGLAKEAGLLKFVDDLEAANGFLSNP